MGGNVLLADSLTKVTRDSFSEPACVHEDEGSVVLANQVSEPIVNLIPDLARHDGLQRRLRQFDGDVEFSCVATVDDGAVGNVVDVDILSADEEARDFFNRSLRGRKANANERSVFGNELLESFDGQRKV